VPVGPETKGSFVAVVLSKTSYFDSLAEVLTWLSFFDSSSSFD